MSEYPPLKVAVQHVWVALRVGHYMEDSLSQWDSSLSLPNFIW